MQEVPGVHRRGASRGAHLRRACPSASGSQRAIELCVRRGSEARARRAPRPADRPLRAKSSARCRGRATASCTMLFGRMVVADVGPEIPGVIDCHPAVLTTVEIRSGCVPLAPATRRSSASGDRCACTGEPEGRGIGQPLDRIRRHLVGDCKMPGRDQALSRPQGFTATGQARTPRSGHSPPTVSPADACVASQKSPSIVRSWRYMNEPRPGGEARMDEARSKAPLARVDRPFGTGDQIREMSRGQPGKLSSLSAPRWWLPRTSRQPGRCESLRAGARSSSASARRHRIRRCSTDRSTTSSSPGENATRNAVLRSGAPLHDQPHTRPSRSDGVATPTPVSRVERGDTLPQLVQLAGMPHRSQHGLLPRSPTALRAPQLPHGPRGRNGTAKTAAASPRQVVQTLGIKSGRRGYCAAEHRPRRRWQ